MLNCLFVAGARARATPNLFDVYKCGCVLCFANKYSFFIFCGCHFMVYWMRNFSKWLIRGSASKVKIFDRHNSHDNVRIACHSFFFFTDNVKHFAVVFSTWNITNREISWIDALLPVFHYFFPRKNVAIINREKKKANKKNVMSMNWCEEQAEKLEKKIKWMMERKGKEKCS